MGFYCNQRNYFFCYIVLVRICATFNIRNLFGKCIPAINNRKLDYDFLRFSLTDYSLYFNVQKNSLKLLLKICKAVKNLDNNKSKIKLQTLSGFLAIRMFLGIHLLLLTTKPIVDTVNVWNYFFYYHCNVVYSLNIQLLLILNKVLYIITFLLQ